MAQFLKHLASMHQKKKKKKKKKKKGAAARTNSLAKTRRTGGRIRRPIRQAGTAVTPTASTAAGRTSRTKDMPPPPPSPSFPSPRPGEEDGPAPGRRRGDCPTRVTRWPPKRPGWEAIPLMTKSRLRIRCLTSGSRYHTWDIYCLLDHQHIPIFLCAVGGAQRYPPYTQAFTTNKITRPCPCPCPWRPCRLPRPSRGRGAHSSSRSPSGCSTGRL